MYIYICIWHVYIYRYMYHHVSFIYNIDAFKIFKRLHSIARCCLFAGCHFLPSHGVLFCVLVLHVGMAAQHFAQQQNEEHRPVESWSLFLAPAAKSTHMDLHLSLEQSKNEKSFFTNPICLLNTCPNAPLWPFRFDSWINFSKQQRLVMFVSAAATPPPRWRVSRQTLRHADMSPSTGVKFFNEVGCGVGDWNTGTIMLRMMSSFIFIISRTSRISTSAIFLHTLHPLCLQFILTFSRICFWCPMGLLFVTFIECRRHKTRSSCLS